MRRLYIFLIAVFLPVMLAGAETPCQDAASSRTLIASGGTSVPLVLLERFPSWKKASLPWKDGMHGIRHRDLKTGNGAPLEPGKVLIMQVKAFLEDGTQYVDTLAERTPARYIYKDGAMPAPFDDSLDGMKEGGRRLIIYPSSVPYDSNPDVFDRRIFVPERTVFFEVHLMWVRDPEYARLNMFR